MSVKSESYDPADLAPRTAADPMSVLCQHHERKAMGEVSLWKVRPLLNDSCPACDAERAGRAVLARCMAHGLEAIAAARREEQQDHAKTIDEMGAELQRYRAAAEACAMDRCHEDRTLLHDREMLVAAAAIEGLRERLKALEDARAVRKVWGGQRAEQWARRAIKAESTLRRINARGTYVRAIAAERSVCTLVEALRDVVYTVGGWRIGEFGFFAAHVGNVTIEQLERWRAALDGRPPNRSCASAPEVSPGD